ncbi:hypothetical protein FHT70_000553 [Rhizobium sp. BK049]|nr:hypothetical protein [Rhizobium sp. BK049]
MGTVAVGPGTLGLAVVYASNPNAYYNKAEWAIAAEYAIKATDKLKITPAVQYYDNYGITAGEFKDDVNAWKAGVTVDYQIVDNFSAKVSVQYLIRTMLTTSPRATSACSARSNKRLLAINHSALCASEKTRGAAGRRPRIPDLTDLRSGKNGPGLPCLGPFPLIRSASNPEIRSRRQALDERLATVMSHRVAVDLEHPKPSVPTQFKKPSAHPPPIADPARSSAKSWCRRQQSQIRTQNHAMANRG